MLTTPFGKKDRYGTNDLVYKSHYGNILARDFPRILPALEANTIVVIQAPSYSLYSMMFHMAPEIWYNKRPLFIFHPSMVRIEEGMVHGMYEDQPVQAPVDETIFLTLDSEKLTFTQNTPF
ncbi:MAG: hypothetical protein ACO3N7_11410 [Kiritimatiellia bacterium]